MSYERDRAPDPDRAEQIFICGVINHAIKAGHLRIGQTVEGVHWEEALTGVVAGVANAWRDYTATTRTNKLQHIRAEMELATNINELNAAASKLANVPLTKVERDTCDALYQSRKATMSTGGAPYG